MASASYGIMGVTLWRIRGVSAGKLQYPTVETVVSCLRNSRFLPWELQFPAWKREVADTSSATYLQQVSATPQLFIN